MEPHRNVCNIFGDNLSRCDKETHSTIQREFPSIIQKMVLEFAMNSTAKWKYIICTGMQVYNK